MQPKKGLGPIDLVTIAGIIVGTGAIVIPLDYLFRAGLVAFAIGLTIYAAMRHSGRPVLR